MNKEIKIIEVPSGFASSEASLDYQVDNVRAIKGAILISSLKEVHLGGEIDPVELQCNQSVQAGHQTPKITTSY